MSGLLKLLNLLKATLLTITLLLSGSGVLAEGQQEAVEPQVQQIPERIEAKDGGQYPLWISEDLVNSVDENGKKQADRSLFPEIQLLVIDSGFEAEDEYFRQQSKASVPCALVHGKPVLEGRNLKPRHSLVDFVESSLAIYRGKTTDLVAGYYAWQPKSLLHIEIGKEIFRESSFMPLEEVWLAVNAGVVHFGERSFCLSDPSLPDVAALEAGVEVLLFVYWEPDDVETSFFRPYAIELIALDSEGELWVPHQLANDLDIVASKSLEDVEEIARLELDESKPVSSP